MANTPPTRRVQAIREHGRAAYDRESIDAILDAGMVAHLGFVHDAQPFVIPTLHARVGDVVYVHGSSASRALRQVGGGMPACLTVTLLDGIVLSRSVFEHDVNYRSVVLLGQAEAVTDPREKLDALEAFMHQLIPGRWPEARHPSQKELNATAILRLPINEASAKANAGGPVDADTEDGLLDVWAGHIPVHLHYGDPIPDPALRDGIPHSQAALEFVRKRRGEAEGKAPAASPEIRVIRPSEQTWGPAFPEPPEGDPQGEELTAFSSADGKLDFGLTRRPSLQREIEWRHDEMALLLEGEVEITTGGTVLRAQAGDVIVTPRGTSGTWRATGPYRKIWVTYQHQSTTE
ncbi:pyridoxamine 5'-phosphate oxidase family protein [Nonomuraea turcica]|uniref:pyridoxamine 5'-phosphate oxidase family protein n=1 Tax=Nonomuraea sp. G32 TaxID=3067274 RepID=UPI00273C6EF7|nr:pyridoxamine 5'-phosphate oxidase family protein [Nonomuraea sp. G32]MDP4506957.1 pyridoxamine 5'-phosphate oxidase family protein [Nonomuraea sp. G32]